MPLAAKSNAISVKISQNRAVNEISTEPNISEEKGVVMRLGKFESILLLLLIGLAAFLLFAEDEELKISTLAPLVHAEKEEPKNPRPEHHAFGMDRPTMLAEKPPEPIHKAKIEQVTSSTQAEQTVHAEPLHMRMLEVMPKSPIRCNIGMKIPLIAMNIDPQHFTFDEVSQYTTWRVEHEKVARIADGELHCLTEGETELSAVIGSHIKKVRVMVMDSPVQSLSLRIRKNIQVGSLRGEVKTMIHFANGESTEVMGAKFVVSDPSIASIVSLFFGSFLLQAMRAGEVRIDAHYLNLSAHQYVTISPQIHPESIYIAAMEFFSGGNIKNRPIHVALHKEELILGVSTQRNGGASMKLSSSLLQWSVSDPSILSLEAMKAGSVDIPMQKIVAKKAGRAEVRVVYESLEATAIILVHASSDAPLRMTLSDKTIRVGDQVKATLFRLYDEGVQAVDFDQKSIHWRSSNSQIIAINHDKRFRMKIEAITEGEAELFASDGEQQVSAMVRVSAKPTGIYFDQGQKVLKINQKFSPRSGISLLYSDGYHRKLDYKDRASMKLTTADSSVLKIVDDHSVLGIGEGQAQLHVKVHDFTMDIPVEVRLEAFSDRKKPISIAITAPRRELALGSRGQLFARTTFDDGSQHGRRNVTWVSSQPHVIDVSLGGQYRVLAAGESEITVQLKNTMLTSRQRFVIPEVTVARLYLEQESIQLPVGSSYKNLSVWMESPQGETKDVRRYTTFTVEDQSVVTINSDGVIRARKAGSSWVRMRYASKETTLMVHVSDDMEPVSMDCHSNETRQMMINENIRIDCNFAYQDKKIDGNEKALTWNVQSSDPSIVAVEGKSLLALQTGTASIRVQVGSLHAQWQVNVSQPMLIRRELLAPDQVQVGSGEQRWLLTEYYSNGLERTCFEHASSRDERVLFVSHGGAIRGLEVGQTILDVYCKGEHYQKTVVVIANDKGSRY